MEGDKPGAVIGSSRQGTREVRRKRYFSGLAAERIAAIWLTLKGYRILGTRVRTAAGEIDLIAVRGRRLAFVEVKRRATRLKAEASLSVRQRRRVRAAAQLWLARNPRFQAREFGFDVVFLVGRSWPVHLRDAL
ncbi:MAG: YraN family protein [Alphaproteobacteria bacterium]|nr:YraN family protein [Alphaproteobacteria bacterium]